MDKPNDTNGVLQIHYEAWRGASSLCHHVCTRRNNPVPHKDPNYHAYIATMLTLPDETTAQGLVANMLAELMVSDLPSHIYAAIYHSLYVANPTSEECLNPGTPVT